MSWSLLYFSADARTKALERYRVEFRKGEFRNREDDGSRLSPCQHEKRTPLGRKTGLRRASATSRGARRASVSDGAARTRYGRGARADGRARGRGDVARARESREFRKGDISREKGCRRRGGIARTVVVLAGDVTHVGCQRVGEDERKQARGARGRSKVERRAVRRVPRMSMRAFHVALFADTSAESPKSEALFVVRRMSTFFGFFPGRTFHPHSRNALTAPPRPRPDVGGRLRRGGGERRRRRRA